MPRNLQVVIGCMDTRGPNHCMANARDPSRDAYRRYCNLDAKERHTPSDGTYPSWCQLLNGSFTLELVP